MNILTIVILTMFGIEDLRTRNISLWVLILSILLAGIYGVHQNGVIYSLCGIVPGVLLLLLGFLQPEIIGKGDGLLAIAYGSVYGWSTTTLWLSYSFLLVSIVGLFGKCLLHKRKMVLPFIPFMGIVHMGLCL